ncbi:glycosyltransferase family 2 protein [Amnibacterium endophyticum]|uniref:Glycosyltransferase family 2 protein n=1 Tax=Amnibacterium endophyticum TaxID=2109337 RepID=A0ABW4LCD7_9MICO
MTDTRVVVAVLTYKRPDDLAAVLPLLVDQAVDVPDGFAVEVLVVDNDPAAGARQQVEAFAASVPVRYEHEAEPGIAAARNRALDRSSDARLLVYIDDDERPEPHWLRLLLETWLGHAAAGVVGPVVSTFAVEPPSFVRAGRFFDRRRLPSGTAVTVAATNNLLLDLDLVRAAGLRFDTTLGTVGGSDTLFTRGLVQAGGRMVWCDEAVVVDVVPAERTTTSWNLRRALRSGNSWSVTALRLEQGGPLQRARLVGRGAVRIGGGAARAAWGAVARSEAHRARGIRSVARGTGMVMGATGLLYREYKR